MNLKAHLSLPVILMLGMNLHAGATATPPSPHPVGDSVVPHDADYYTHKLKNNDVEIIYPEDNLPYAQHAADIEAQLHRDYQKFFGWKLDTTLYVGFISKWASRLTPLCSITPINRQMNFIGGTLAVDHFASNSWLDTLLFHETVHNYELNVKASPASRALYSIFGNGTFWFPIPWLITPNIVENAFMLEGNAVLNEAWHGEGGRLYNGRITAEVLLQAKAGNIKPQRVYNNIIEFPYGGDIWYHIGGHYNKYMAEKYGINKINSYFKIKSQDFVWPQYTNYSMKEATGVDFESSLQAFEEEYAKIAQKMVLLEGEKIATSQFFNPIGSDQENAYFVTNESAFDFPSMHTLNKKNLDLQKDKDGWLGFGRPVAKDGKVYVQGSTYVNPWRLKEGLFDAGRFIVDETEGKMVQGYLTNGDMVYFDVKTSFEVPQLYIGDEFIGTTNSSVYVDGNDIYYFKNENRAKERTLYKNKTALYTFKSFYGNIVGVDAKGAVYFITNSEFGSSLYRYDNGHLTRASDADNLVDARILDANRVLALGVGEDEYYYVINDLKSIEEKPYETKIFFEEKPYYSQYKVKKHNTQDNLDLSDNYYSLLDMKYSATNLTFAYSPTSGAIGSFDINFADPLNQNSFQAFVKRDDSNVTIAGAGYANAQYFINYSVIGYGLVDDDDQNISREYGVIANATIDYLKKGYYSGDVGITYFEDYSTDNRNPLSLTARVGRNSKFGYSMYMNSSYNLKGYGVKVSDDEIYGAEANIGHSLGYEFYFNMSAKYSATNSKLSQTTADAQDRGVKVSSFDGGLYDPSTIAMPTSDTTRYVKNAAYGDISVQKVLNFPAYFFTFPLSIQREAIELRYRHYDINEYTNTLETLNNVALDEYTLGMRFDFIILNNISIPLTLNIYMNDNEDYYKDGVGAGLGTSFAF